MSRISLTSDATYFISPSGSDTTGDGSTANPWKTRTFAYNHLQSILDLAGYNLVVQMMDGVYTDEMPGGGMSGSFIGQRNVLSVHFRGNLTVSNGVIISTLSHTWALQNGAAFLVSGQYLISKNGVAEFVTGPGTQLFQGPGVTFQDCGGGHIYVSYWAAWAALNDYKILGNAPYHFFCVTMGGIGPSPNLVVDLGPNPRFFSQAFAVSTGQGNIIAPALTFRGSGIGRRFSVDQLSYIQVGGNQNYFPGNTAGVVDASSFGVYR